MQMRRPTFFERYALFILMAIFFLVPFALRGARLSLEQMRNDVKDWLPSDFAETSELDWFRDHFLGEQFVLISWEGCTADDQRLDYLARLLVPPPLTEEDKNKVPIDHRLPDFIGDELGLYYPGDDHQGWAGQNEKWFLGNDATWYYLLENGELYKWNGQSTVIGALSRAAERVFTGGNSADGDYVKKVHEEYYKKPKLLQARLFKSVTTGPDVLAQLAAPGGTLVRDDDPSPKDLEEAREKALSRLTGTLFGPDGEQTCLIVTLTDAGKVDLRRTMGHGVLGRPLGQLEELAIQAGVPLEELRLGGPPVDNVSIDEEGERTLARLVSFSVIIGLGLSYMCLRSIKLTIMVFFVGGISAVTSLSLIYWTAGRFIWWLDPTTDAVIMSMPAVVYVLGLSGAIHIVNYYKDVVNESGTLRNAPELTIAHGWYPCTIAAVTTAVGLGSLATSSITPIHKFGIFSAMGVLATLLLLFTYLPAALQMWPPNAAKKKGESKPIEPSAAGQWIRGIGDRIGDFIIAHNIKVALGCLAIFLFFAFGLQYLKTSVQLLKMFDDDARIIQDYAWLEDNLGKLVPMELVVRVEPEMLYYDEADPEKALNPLALKNENKVDPKFQYKFLERMEMAQRVANVVEEYLGPDGAELVGPPMSALTFAPELPDAGNSTASLSERYAYSKQLEASFNEFVKSDYLRVDKKNGAELWRVSLRLGALENIDYGNFVNDLKQVTEPIMDAYQARDRILAQIDKDRDGAGYVNAKVALLGVNYEAAKEAAAGKSEHHDRYGHLDATKVFSETLRDLLVNARIKLLDHDPNVHSQERLDYILNNNRGHADYVVLVEPNAIYDMGAISDNANIKGTFDVTAHEYTGKEIPRMYSDDRPPVSLVYTGVVPVVYKAARTLLTNLIESTVWAFALIALVMMLVLKSFRAGLISMLPNVFPICIVFGFMSWTGIEVDIGTMMTASVAMGVAVDDTVHFLTWFRWGLDEGYTRSHAIKEAYNRCAMAMFQTTIIGGLGLAVFAFSTFTPTQRFGYLMVSLLAVALIGDLVFLPALLAGPLGRVFRPDRKARSNREHDDDAAETPSEEPSAESESPAAASEEMEEPRVYPVHGRSRPA
ncbi:putative efflux pump membrane transporter TtgB [Bremerella volcania]|uniref:Putative efflux pump membrane transporter TtgB n=1 Tax=Bremerella volcania TaxID=2527984 RepID=A0A518CFX3_9BACT|nr:MMPL family transporter [Bremerella volcania]QDU78119.1 putative efflux pump membrane transporter TtgB [Bremerella volcania]